MPAANDDNVERSNLSVSKDAKLVVKEDQSTDRAPSFTVANVRRLCAFRLQTGRKSVATPCGRSLSMIGGQC